MMLAQTAVDIPLSDTMKTLIGILGVLTAGLMVMWFAIAWKKLFGRRPPIGEELDKLEKRMRAELVASHSRVYATAETAQAAADEAAAEIQHYVPKTDFDKFVDENRREHENLFSKIGGVERGARIHLDEALARMQSASEHSREKLHERINEVLTAVSELRGELKNRK